MTPYHQRQLVLMRQMERSLAQGSPVSTVVPLQNDYAHDPQLCLTTVSFVAPETADRIYNNLITTLQTIEPDFYYYRRQSMHLTIQNIRVINNPPHFTEADIAKVQPVLSAIAPRYEPFSFTLCGLMSMPTSVSVIALIEPRYDSFVRSLRQQLVACGVPDDKTYFTDEMAFANITVCRYTHSPQKKFLAELSEKKDSSFGIMTAKTMSLITTNAGAHPTKTTIFGTYRFGQK